MLEYFLTKRARDRNDLEATGYCVSLSDVEFVALYGSLSLDRFCLLGIVCIV